MNYTITIRKRLTMVALLVAMMLPAMAQDSLYVVKGNTIVDVFEVNDGDYATFQRPSDVPQQQTVTLEGVTTGKNFIKYEVITTTSGQYYAHAFFQSNTIDNMLQKYYGVKIEEADEQTLQAALRFMVQYYGYTDQGTQTYTITNGDNDGYVTDFFIPGGQDFYVVACNLTNVDDQAGTSKMGDELSVVKLTTLTAGESAETIDIEYTGLNDDGEATYTITPSSGIVTLYTMLAKKKELDQNTSIYGFDKVFFGGAESWTATDWNKWGSEQAWELDGENDYVMTVLGIDANGDRVTVTNEQHITPASDNCPKVNVLSKEKNNGTVTVNYEITPSNVTAAHVRLMKENDVKDAKNNGQTLDEIATGGDAEEVTSTINNSGEATFSKADLPRGWYDLLISATDENGTTVTEVCFHSHLADAEWEIRTTTFPTASVAKAQKAAEKRLKLSGKQVMKSMAALADAEDEESADSVYVVKDGMLVASYELETEVDYFTFHKPAAPDTPQESNTFIYDGTQTKTRAVFYKINEDDGTADFYLANGDIDTPKELENSYQYAHITIPYNSLGTGAIDITGDTEFKFELVDNYNDQTFSLSSGNVGSATGTISVAKQGEDTYTIAIAIEGFGGSHSLTATYTGQCMPYDYTTPNAYALQNGESIALNSAVITLADGLYTVYLSQKEGVTTVEGMADADIVLVTPEEYLNDGIKGFSGGETRAKVSITYDGVTYCQANTQMGGDSALAMGGNVDLKLNDGQVNVDFNLYSVYKYSNANMSGHFEGPATVIE